MVKRVKKAIERRAEMIKTARELFAMRGYEKATMQELMERLDIAKGTIYHYFPSKEALLEAVIIDIVESHLQRMEALLKENQGNALEKIQAMVALGNLASENQEILEHLHQPGNEALHVRLLAAVLKKQAPLYAELIQQGCEEGIFQTQFPLECAEWMLSAIQFLTDRGIYPWTQEEVLRRIQALPTLCEQLLKASPGSFQFLLHQTDKR